MSEELAAGERRALKRLAAAAGAVARPIPGEEGRYGVYAHGDRRRRPLAALDRAGVRRLVSSGALGAAGEDGFALTAAGCALARRLSQSGPDRFRAQHLALEPVSEDASQSVTGSRDGALAINRAESPLGWLMRRAGPNGERYLSAREFAAGERLRADFLKGRYLGRLTSDWTAPPRGSAPRGPGEAQLDPAESVVAARARVSRALEHVGAGLSSVLSAVCLEGRGLDDVERGFGWPRRSGKVVLRIALARLADFYGLPTPPPDAEA